VYNYALNGIATLMRKIVKENNPNFASMYKALESGAEESLKDLIAYFNEN
jgi:hypothetical protein